MDWIPDNSIYNGMLLGFTASAGEDAIPEPIISCILVGVSWRIIAKKPVAFNCFYIL